MGIILKNVNLSWFCHDPLTKNDQQSYAVYLLANFCMPALSGMKPSNLIRADKKNINDRAGFLRMLENQTEPFGCGFTVLYEDDGMLLLFIFHRIKIAETLACRDNKLFLEARGYCLEGDAAANAVRKLRKEYEAYQSRSRSVNGRETSPSEYPHEVGVLLGYPLRDVVDFIRYNGANYIICGYWKVYHDAENARRIFESYRQVREITIRNLLAGKKLQDMRNIKY